MKKEYNNHIETAINGIKVEKSWAVEHKVRSLISQRGMRPSKAISRVLDTRDPETIKALASLWVDGEFAVSIGNSRDLFMAAYEQVRSCMQHKGALCHRAYAPHGTSVAVVTIDGLIVARALVRNNSFNSAYGPMAWALKRFLSYVLGFAQASLFEDCTPAVFETCAYQEKFTRPARFVEIWEPAAAATRRVSSLLADGHSAGNVSVRACGSYSVVELKIPERVTFITRSAKEFIFAPYVDR